MRVNIYAEELPRTPRIEIVEKVIGGQSYIGLRIYLELPATVKGVHYQGPFLRRGIDDSSSAVTFWGKRDLRRLLRDALIMLDEYYNSPEPEPAPPPAPPPSPPLPAKRHSGRPRKAER